MIDDVKKKPIQSGAAPQGAEATSQSAGVATHGDGSGQYGSGSLTRGTDHGSHGTPSTAPGSHGTPDTAPVSHGTPSTAPGSHGTPSTDHGSHGALVAGSGSHAAGIRPTISGPPPSLRTAQDWPDDLDSLTDDDLWAFFRETESGSARLYNRLNRGRLVFVTGWEQWLVWQGHHWTADDFSIAYQRTESVVGAYRRLDDHAAAVVSDPGASQEDRQAAEEIRRTVARRIEALRSKRGKEAVLAQTQRVFDPLTAQPGDIDRHPYLLACPNGVVDLRTGSLRPGDPSDMLLNACPTRFDEDLFLRTDDLRRRAESGETLTDAEKLAADPCPRTTEFLLTSMGKDAGDPASRDRAAILVDFLWRLLGYGIIRERKDHIFPIFWGAHGRNGKDTLIKLITHVLGNALSGNVPVELFLQTQQTRNSSAPSPDVMALRGMCLAWINEAEDGQRFAMAKLKSLTGGGLITARGLQDKKMTTFMQSHLPIMTTNELPRAKADDDAFWARVLLIKWERSFVDDPDPAKDYQRPADPYIDEKIQSEAEGVLVRLVQGALDYLRDGLKVPGIVQTWTREQRNTMDDLSAFFEECCLLEPKPDGGDSRRYVTEVSAKDLLDAWTIWYGENRDAKHIPSGKSLGIMLDKREIFKYTKNGTWRKGITLNAEYAERVAKAQRDREER